MSSDFFFFYISCSLLTSVCSACSERSPEPAGERSHSVSAACVDEDPPQLDWLQDGYPGSSDSHRRVELYRHLGTDAAALPCVIHRWCSPEALSGHRNTELVC